MAYFIWCQKCMRLHMSFNKHIKNFSIRKPAQCGHCYEPSLNSLNNQEEMDEELR